MGLGARQASYLMVKGGLCRWKVSEGWS